MIQYAERILDELDTNKFIDWRLFRVHCSYQMGVYTKDLGTLGRDLRNVILVDVSSVLKWIELSHLFQDQSREWAAHQIFL